MSARECVEAFEMAQRETIKAWGSTAMLARTRAAKIEQITDLWSRAEPTQIAAFLSDLAGRSYEGFALKTGLDASKLAKMSYIVLKVLVKGQPAATRPEAILASLANVTECALEWIGTGRSEVSPASADLERIGQLVTEPEARLALLAPFAPAIATVGIVVRAHLADFPFQHPVQVHTP